MPQAEIFGDYILLERISHGGMAEIFAAKKHDSPKIFVIKRILPAMASDEAFIRMFTDEATIAGELSHLNICQIYELGCIRDMHFISMEYVWGKDVLQLQARLRRLGRKMSPELIVFVGAEVCKGLDYAHRKTDEKGQSLEIIHRDVSPQNILISYDGDIRLIDFGIASAKHRSSQTQAGVIKGKFGYMAPEQVRGKKLDQRADLFSLGITLWEMATTKRLFVADNDFAVLDMVKRAKITKPSSFNPEIPEELDRIIMKALTRDRDKRYTWASEIERDLLSLFDDRSAMTADKSGQLLRSVFAKERRRERRALEIYRDSAFDDVGNTASRDFVGDFTLVPKSRGPTSEQVVEDATLGDGPDSAKTGTMADSSDTQHSINAVIAKPDLELDLPTKIGSASSQTKIIELKTNAEHSSERMRPQLVDGIHVAEHVGDVNLREDTQVSVVASLSDQAPPVEKQPSAFPVPLATSFGDGAFSWFLIGAIAVGLGSLIWAIKNQLLVQKHKDSMLVLLLDSKQREALLVGKVSIDGKECGDVSTAQPLIIDPVAPGSHEISIATAIGKTPFFSSQMIFRPWKTEVLSVDYDKGVIDLSRPQTSAAVQKMTTEGHRIFNLLVFPKDAQVVVDGKLVDAAFQVQSGSYKIPIKPGEGFRLEVTREHYRPVSRHLLADSVGEESLSIRLETEVRQTLRIRSNPKSAQVFVDGILSGRTPLRIKMLRYGRHLVSIAKPGYKTWRKDIRVDWGKGTKSIDVRLKRK